MVTGHLCTLPLGLILGVTRPSHTPRRGVIDQGNYRLHVARRCSGHLAGHCGRRKERNITRPERERELRANSNVIIAAADLDRLFAHSPFPYSLTVVRDCACAF